MKINYEVIYSLNLANALSEVDALIGSVNTHLAEMGCDERLTLNRQPIVMSISVARELSEKDIAKMKDIIMGQLCQSFVGANPVCESFRRQSGNVSQSAL